MKVCGLVAEFNPFHNGHKTYLEMAKKLTDADIYILSLSPNFVQRGEVSVESKEEKVKKALDNGVDIVIEIPTIYTLESADIYASASLNMLVDLGAQKVVFGTESGDTNEFIDKFDKKDFGSPRMDEIIQEFLKQGYSYPKAKSEASKVVSDFYLENPNDILGYSYLKAIHNEKLSIKPLCYKRINNEKSNENIGSFSSAMAIRETYKKLEDHSKYHFLSDYFDLLKYKLTTTSSDELKEIHLVEEGIENLFIKNIVKAKDMDDFIHLCTSKRYSGARIKRTICHILLNTRKNEAKAILSSKPPYIRVLGLSKKGQDYLSRIRKDNESNIVTRFSAQDNPLLLAELKATTVYNLLRPIDEQLEAYENEKTLFPIREK